MAKRVFKRRTKKGTSVSTRYVPKKNQKVKVKSWSYSTPSKGGKTYVVQTTRTKTYRSAKAAAKARMRS